MYNPDESSYILSDFAPILGYQWYCKRNGLVEQRDELSPYPNFDALGKLNFLFFYNIGWTAILSAAVGIAAFKGLEILLK